MGFFLPVFTLMFLPVVLAAFLTNFGTGVAEYHDNCVKYDEVLPNGKKKIDLYHDCGITNASTVKIERNLKCLAKKLEIVNKDGSINGLKLMSLLQRSIYPELNEETKRKWKSFFLPSAFFAFHKKVKRGQVKGCDKINHHIKEIQKMMDNILTQSLENFFSLLPKEAAKICPKDQIYGNPDE